MSVYQVDVGIAVARPLRTDDYVRVLIEAEDEFDAELTALLMAASSWNVLTPVSSIVCY